MRRFWAEAIGKPRGGGADIQQRSINVKHDAVGHRMAIPSHRALPIARCCHATRYGLKENFDGAAGAV